MRVTKRFILNPDIGEEYVTISKVNKQLWIFIGNLDEEDFPSNMSFSEFAIQYPNMAEELLNDLGMNNGECEAQAKMVEAVKAA